MLNFLNPTVLFAAAAALVPLIIHLFSKRRVKVVEFSSLKHLKAMQRRQVRRLKIRQLLLLLLRMLILLAIVLAFARPATEGGNIGSHASVSAVIVFDNTASMNRYTKDGDLFELARKRTAQLLETFGESDEVMLLPVSQAESAEGLSEFTSAGVVRDLLSRLSPGYGETSLQAALEQADDFLSAASNLNKELYLITDYQRHALPDSAVLRNSDVRVYAIDFPIDQHDNCGITDVSFGGQLLLPGHEFTVTATIKNYEDRDRDDLIASLFIDGNRVAQSDVRVTAGNETTVHFIRAVSSGGFHSGYVELSDDKFPGDNRYYFSFRIPDQFTVLIASDDEAAKFISLALVPSLSLNQYWSVKESSFEDLAGVDLSQYDVIILTDPGALSDSYAARVKSYVRGGKALLVAYGAVTEVNRMNSVWSEVTGVVFDEPIRQDFSRAGFYTLETVDVNHPVFSVFDFGGEEMPELKFYTLPKMHVIGEAETVARFSGDRPALIEAEYGSGQVLAFTGPLAPQYSDLTGHAFFVPFISRMTEYLASDLSLFDMELYVGEDITRTLSVRGAPAGSMEMVTPDSSIYYLTVDEEKGNVLVRAAPVRLPGIYSIRHVGFEVDRFAVNIDPAECDLADVDRDRLAQAIGADSFNVLEPETNLAAAVGEFRYGKELWQLFLWIAVILLAVEMILSRGASTEG